MAAAKVEFPQNGFAYGLRGVYEDKYCGFVSLCKSRSSSCYQDTDDVAKSKFKFTAVDLKEGLYYIQSGSVKNLKGINLQDRWLSYYYDSPLNESSVVKVVEKESDRSIWKLIPTGAPMHFKLMCIYGGTERGYLSFRDSDERNGLYGISYGKMHEACAYELVYHSPQAAAVVAAADDDREWLQKQKLDKMRERETAAQREREMVAKNAGPFFAAAMKPSILGAAAAMMPFQPTDEPIDDSDDEQKSEIEQAHGLSVENMKKLIKKCQLLSGRTPTSDKVRARIHDIFEIKKNCQSWNKHFVAADSARITTSITYSEAQRSLAESGYSNVTSEVSASYGCPGAKAALSAQLSKTKESSQSDESSEQEISYVAERNFPRVDVELDRRCVKLTKEFEVAFKKFLTSDAFSSDDAQAMKIRDDFRDKYGYWVDLRAQLGGKLYRSRTVTREQHLKKVTSEKGFKASVGAQFDAVMGVGSSLSIGGANGGSEEKQQTSAKEMDDIAIEAIGGDPLKNSITSKDFAPWKESVALPDNWRIISVDDVCNVLSLGKFMRKNYRDDIKIAYDVLQKKIEVDQQQRAKAKPSPKPLNANVPVPETVYAYMSLEKGDYRGYMSCESSKAYRCNHKSDDDSDSKFVLVVHDEEMSQYYIQSASTKGENYWLSCNWDGPWWASTIVGVYKQKASRSIWKLIPYVRDEQLVPMHFKIQCRFKGECKGYLSVKKDRHNELVSSKGSACVFYVKQHKQ